MLSNKQLEISINNYTRIAELTQSIFTIYSLKFLSKGNLNCQHYEFTVLNYLEF